MHHSSPRISLLQLARTMLYIGVAGYGGGPAIIGMLHQLLVQRRRWLSEQDFHLGLSLSQLLPGANALSVVTYLGYQLHGGLGALVAPVCFLAPATVLMIVLSAVYFAYGQVAVAQELFTGLGAIVVALLVNAMVGMGRSGIKDRPAVGIALAGFLALYLFHASFVLIILASAAAGWVIYRQTTELAPMTPRENAPSARGFWWGVLAVTLAVTALLVFTRHTTSTQLFLALLHVGALTFGGGYASVPLFQQQAVSLHHWLTTREFLDGLALGQITPGPVLITGTFIGYRVLGVWGALLATVAIFAPGGVAMFFVARQHERIRNLVWLRTMVRGVVAAFIGILLTVTIQLAQHSITDWRTAALAVVGALVLLLGKIEPLWVILAAAAISPVLFHAW